MHLHTHADGMAPLRLRKKLEQEGQICKTCIRQVFGELTTIREIMFHTDTKEPTHSSSIQKLNPLDGKQGNV
jgi:hypothetical protein